MAALTPSAGRLAGRAAGWLRRVVRLRSGDSPTKLQAATALTVLCAIALSIGGWYSIDRRETAIDDAAGAAEQLIRVQDVRVLIVQADSIASNAYLLAGQEPREQREQYDDRIATATSRLVAVSKSAAASDVATLEQVSTQLTTYVGLVEQARSNNRQGYPVGAAYQRQARVVAESLVESLRIVEQSSRSRVNNSIDRAERAGWLLVLTAFVLLSVLIGGSGWLAVRWRRLVNVPLAVAGLLTLLVLTVGAGISHRAVSNAGDTVRGPLAAADLLAQARAAGFDARSNEALTLIFRGNGQGYETQWELSTNVVDQALTRGCDDFGQACEAIDQYAEYRASHDEIRTLDDEEGDWDAAVALLTGGGRPATSFDAFAQTADSSLALNASNATQGFDDAVSSLGGLRVLVLLVGVVSAVLAVIGYGQRLREYR
jgi:hypothetical protein